VQRPGFRHVAALVALVFLAHFYLCGSFGLYEDDYQMIAPSLGEPLGRAMRNALSDFNLRQWPTGRPLNHALPALLSAFGYKLGGLRGVYLLASMVGAVNAVLVYSVARRLFGATAGLVAGVFFVLNPADTTHQFLTHCGHIQTSVTFFLIGAGLLMSEHRRLHVLAYLVAFLSLLSYEAVYLLFILYPLALARPTRGFALRLGKHSAACAVSMFAIAAVRYLQGESRVEGVVGSPAHTAYIILAAPWYGFTTSASAFGKFLPHAIADLNPAAAAMGGAIALMLALALWPARPWPAGDADGEPAARHFFLTPSGPTFLGFALVFIGMWLFSYCFTFTHFPPTAQSGRMTSTHTASIFPAAMVAGLLGREILAWSARRRGWTTVGLVALVVYCGMLGAYAFEIQQGYAAAWAAEKNFWQQFFALCPESQRGVTVVVDGDFPEPSRYIESFNEEVVRIPNIIFNDQSGTTPRLPAAPARKWKAPARPPPQPPFEFVITGDPDYFIFTLQRHNSALVYRMRYAAQDSPWYTIDESNLICLEYWNGRLERVPQLSVPGLAEPLRTQVSLAPNPAAQQKAEQHALYRILTQ
jgi:hypothetical protein